MANKSNYTLPPAIFSILAFANNGLSDVQNILANHKYFHAERFMAITRNPLGEQLQVADFVRANEGGNIFVEAVKLEQFVFGNIHDRECTPCDGVQGLRAQRRDIHCVGLLGDL